jgi:hypothetical protein
MKGLSFKLIIDFYENIYGYIAVLFEHDKNVGDFKLRRVHS